MPEQPDWVGEVYELRCPNCKRILSLTLKSEIVMDEGTRKRRIVNEECECGFHIEVYGDGAK